VRWLLENELVDEINLLTSPVIIGQGTRLFPDTGPDTALESARHPDHTQRGDDPGLPAQRATAVRNVHRQGKLATKLGVLGRPVGPRAPARHSAEPRDAAHRFTTAVAADVAAVDPPALVAVTCERRRWPTSALPMPYDDEVAPLIGAHAFPFESHLSHW
jgi:hypothetical protein